MRFTSSLTLALFLFGATVLQAAVPQELHYNGYLTNAVGEAIECSDAIQCPSMFNLNFRLYAEESGEEVLWQEDHVGVPMYQGSFHVILGSNEALSTNTISGPLWLGIRVNGGAELTPRQKLTAAPFAYRAALSDEAANATKLGGMTPSDYASQASLNEIESNLAPVATAGLPGDLADGDDDTLGSLVCAEGQIPKANASGIWVCGSDVDTDTTIEDSKLTEEEVDAFVANNGYASQDSLSALQTSLAPIATQGLPADLADGDNDTLNGLACAEGEVPKANSSGIWICGPDIDTDTDTTIADTTLTEEEVDAYVANNGYFVGTPSSIPSGLISMWSGSVDGIPSGWVLCDGSNGTPNLLDRFILSIPSADVDPGAEGGSHTKTVGHTHDFSGGTSGVGPTGCGACVNPSPNFVGGHSHSFSGTTETTAAEVDVRPRFYTLAFIMKL